MKTLLPILLFLCTCFTLQAQLQLTIEEDYFAGPFNRDANYYLNYKTTHKSLEYHNQPCAPQDFVHKGYVWAKVIPGKWAGWNIIN